MDMRLHTTVEFVWCPKIGPRVMELGPRPSLWLSEIEAQALVSALALVRTVKGVLV